MTEIKAREKDNAARGAYRAVVVSVMVLRDCGFGEAGDTIKLSYEAARIGIENGVFARDE